MTQLELEFEEAMREAVGEFISEHCTSCEEPEDLPTAIRSYLDGNLMQNVLKPYGGYNAVSVITTSSCYILVLETLSGIAVTGVVYFHKDDPRDEHNEIARLLVNECIEAIAELQDMEDYESISSSYLEDTTEGRF